MDGELPPWNKHGSHNSRVPYNIAGEDQEDNDLIGDSFAAGEPMSSLSSCMSGAFKALLPDYHGTSSEITTNSVKYSYSPNNHCLIKPGAAVDEKMEERREKKDFLKDPLCEPSSSVTHLFPPRCAQYVPQEKNRDVDQGNCNWTSVIKDALEMSNGMEMEPTLSMDVCGPVMGFNAIYKGPETEAKFTLRDDYQIAGSNLNERQDGQGMKEEPDSFISMLSDGISKKKDVLEMGENDEPSILAVGSSLGKEELGRTGFRENEPGLLPGFNRSSYTPFSSSEGFVKSEIFPGIPSVKQSVEHTLQGTTQGSESCKDVSPKKTAGTDICFKHATGNNKTVPEGSNLYGLHHLDLQKECHQAEITDGNTSINYQDHSLQHDVQDKKVNTSNLHVSETKTNNTEISLKMETESAPEINNSTLRSETVPDQAVVSNKIRLDYKCKDSPIEPGESGKLNPSTVLLPCDEKVQNSEKNENAFLNITSESCIPPPTENVHAAPPSPTSRINCSSQPDLQKALQKCKKSRKRRKSELEKLNEPIHKSNKRDCSVYGTGISDCAVKPDTIGSEDTNQDFSLTKYDSTALKEEDLITNGVNPPSPRRKLLCPSQLRMTQLELVKDTAETSQKPDHSCSETSQVKASSTTRIDKKAVSRRKQKNRTRLGLKTKKSARFSNQCLSQSTVLSSEEDCTSHFQVSDAIQVKEVSNPAIIQQAISGLESSIPECSPKKSTKKKTLQTENYALLTLQSKGDPHDPTTCSEVEADLMDLKKHQKLRIPGIKASKGNNDMHATSLLNSQPLLDSVSQTDSVSTSVTESSNILSPKKNPKKSRQKKRADINKASKSPQENIPLPLCKSKENMVISNTRTMKEKRSVKKATRTDDCDTTLLDLQPSTATQEQTDSAPTAGTEVESPVVFRTPRKSVKKKLSNIKRKAVHIPTVDQTKAQSVLNPLSESDASIVQPTIRRFSPRKTLDKLFSRNTVSENCETVHLNQSISSNDSVSATVTDISDFSQKNTEKKSSKRRKTNTKFMEAQTSTTSQKEDVTVLPLEDLASIVVSNPEKIVKVKKLSRKKTNDNHLNDNLVEDTSLLAFVTQENSVSPSKVDSSSSFRQTNTLKKPRKKTVTKIKNEAEEILGINQHEDLVAITSKPSANIVASSSQMTLKEERLMEKAITKEVKDNHATALFVMQTSTATLQHTECVSTSFARSTSKKSKKMSDIQGGVLRTPAFDQSMQQELHPFDSASTTEIDTSDVLNQKKIKVKTKRQSKKVTKRKTHVTQAISSIRERSFPATVQHENLVSNRNTNSRSEEMTQKHMKKKTSALKVQNFQPEDYAEHSALLPELLPPPISLGKDATPDPCIKTDAVKESAETHVENQVFITTEDVACSQSLLKKAKKIKRKQLLVQKEVNEQSKILELAHRENKMSDAPSVVREVASENFEKLEADSCDQHLKVAKRKAKKCKQVAETHEFANVSLSQEKNTGSDRAGVTVTFTQIQDFCKVPDGHTVGSQQPEKDGDVVNQKDVIMEESKLKDLKTTKTPKTKSRKAGRKKRKIAGLLTQTVKEEEHKDISYDNRIACDFQNDTQIQISDSSQRTAVIPDKPVMKSRKSTRTQSNLGLFVENVSTQGSLDIAECHTRLGETLYSSMQPADCENQYTVEEKSPRRGRPPSIKSKEQKLPLAHLEDNTSPSVQISDLSSCEDSAKTPSSSMQTADCEDQYNVKQKSPRRGRPPSIKRKEQKLSIPHLEDNSSPSVQISDLTSCQDSTETHYSSMQPADCENQYTVEEKSPRRGRPPSIKSKEQKLPLAHLEDNSSPSVQISDLTSYQDSTETLSSSMQPADCEDQYTVQQKSTRRGRPPSIKSKKKKSSIAHLEDNTSPSVQISDLSSCQDSTETLSNSIQLGDCEGQYTKQKSPRQGRSPSNKNKKKKSSIAHLEDNTSPSIQMSDFSSCPDSTKTLSSSMQPADCEGQYTKQKSPRRGGPPSIKSKKRKLSIPHLEDNTSPSVQISDLSSCPDSTETLSSSMQPAECEGQYTVKQKSPKRGRPPSIKSKKRKLSIGHLEDNTSPSVQMSDLSSCQDSTETLSSSMQIADCEGQYTVEQKSPRRGRPPSIKNKKQKLSAAHLEDNTSPSVQISDPSSYQDSTENNVKAAASPAKQKVVQPLKKRRVIKVDTVMVTKQLGTDPSESLQSATDDLSHNIPANKHKKGKNFKRLKLSSLRVSSRTSEPSVKGFQKADIHSLPQNFTNNFNEKGKTSLPMPGTVKKQEGDVLADIKIENKATVKVVKRGKRGRKRRKIKEPHSDLVTEHEELQRLTTKAKNNKRQDCSEPAKSLLTKFSITNECSNEEQNSIVSSEKNDNKKTKLSSVEMLPALTEGTCQITPKTEVLCSSSTQLSSNLMKEVKKYKEHDAEPNGNDLFAVIDNTGLSGGELISSNVVKKESEHIELKCTPETDGLGVKMSGENIPDTSPEIENTFQTSTEQKVDGFTQDSEECVVMPNKVSNKRTVRSKPKEIMKKPLTCKYCGVSFRHITAYAIHQRIHTGDKPYKCKICGKTFAHLSKLKSHRNVHKQDTSFPCPCCSQKFLQKDDLLFHFQIHLQESKANSEPHKAIKSNKNTLSDVCSETPNNYGCLICKKNFVNHIKLQNHMQAHEVERPLTCKDCGKKFWKPSSLAAHEKSHWPVKPYACSICGKGFNQLKALKKHSQDHAGETPFSCFHCGHAFSALSELRMHQASKTCIARKNDEAGGNIEGFIVSQGVDGQVNTPVFFKCQICKQLFRKWCQYTLHLQTHTSSPPYICFSCGQCYEKDSEMNVHCEVCCQSSGEEQICGASLSEIMQSVTQAYPLKCTSSQTLPSTGFQLNSQTQTSSEQLPQLPQSMDEVPTQTRETDLSQLPKTCSTQSPIKLPIAQSPNHSDVGCTSTSSSLECIEITQSLWKFKCSRCGQRFEQYRTLSAHLKMHAPGFRYTCAHCGQFFERWSKLWLHQRRHRLKSRRYSCNQCNLQFHFFSSFKEHMIDHAGQSPYTCPLCPKTFIQEASLHAHQCESHKLCKSLKCDVCSKTFSSLTNLIKHSLLHNGSTSHICLPCNLSFTNTRVLKEHLKTHTTSHRPALPDIPSEPLDFPHKCKRCRASFSTGDLLYAHQIRHSRDAKTHVCPTLVPTSKLSDSCCSGTTSTPSTTRRNHISNLKLDGIPNDESLYVYSHPDRLYVPPSRRVQIPVINLDPDEHEEVSDSQNTSPELPNSEITAQSDSTHLPQATSGQETTNLNLSESIKEMANGKCNYSFRNRRSRFVETSVDMEMETTAHEESESFECADCTEKLSSVLSLYEHYILHAMGDTYVH
ncbi:hypothetical protein ABG768_012060 [Culter alburnus]|uniref:C2H2-type domain-containing protein n=1 Tax=Culter alburnus TaxID=194366 RepID=A0AAW1Z8U5_CULAL